MTKQNHVFIPVLTTVAGRSLTANNWQSVNVSCVSFYLTALLVKPGLAYLKVLPDWSRYSGWEGDWILNASMPSLPTDKGQYIYRSPYDGTSVICSMDDLVDIVLNLRPQAVILPQEFRFDDRLVDITILQDTPYGESDKPANDACSGIVYSADGAIDLREKRYAMQFECIDEQCQCPTCRQRLTRAYLHHLLEHTPLLCHRFLIQHNVYHSLHS